MASGGLDKAKTGIEIVGEVIRLAGDDPNVKQAAGELGKSALTVAKTINNALMPLAAVNFAFDKARKYFAESFESDLGEKASRIPPEELTEPKASIAGPALQGLAFTHEEENLKDLFLELIAGSMDKRRAALAHPAFVEILKQLQSEEARLLKSVLPQHIVPIAKLIRRNKTDHGQVDLKSHILNITNTATKEPSTIDGLSAMVDNWIRLGLISVDYDSTLTEQSRYDFLLNRPELSAQPPEHESSTHVIDWQKGIMFPTEFGRQFAKAVSIIG